MGALTPVDFRFSVPVRYAGRSLWVRLQVSDDVLGSHIDRFLGLPTLAFPLGPAAALPPSLEEWLLPDSPRPSSGTSPEATLATFLAALKQQHRPGRPHHGAAVAMGLSVPVSSVELSRPLDRPTALPAVVPEPTAAVAAAAAVWAPDVWRGLLRASLSPRHLARRVRASSLRPLTEFALCADPRRLGAPGPAPYVSVDIALGTTSNDM